MYDTSSSTHTAPDEQSGRGSVRDMLTPKKRRASVIKEEKEGAQTALKRRAKKAKEKIVSRKTQEELQDMQDIREFWQDVFGHGAIASFFISITGFLAGEEGTFDAKAFDKELTKRANELAKKGFNIDEFVVAHRSLGYGRHRENSEEGLKAALNSGEKQIEIDIRKGPDGKLYLSHNKIKGKKETKKLISFEKALELIAESNNQDVVFFFDIKEPGIIKQIDQAIAKIDRNYVNRENYRPIQNRHFVLTFDKEILREAKKSNGSRPLIYYYFPTQKYSIMGSIARLLGRKRIKSILGKIDYLTGSDLAASIQDTGLKMNGKQMGKKHKTSFNLWSGLPSSDIIRTIRSSNGYLCIPAPLATKSLIKKIKAKGCKVAVWGADDERIKKMIYQLGVDLVISDTPRSVSKKPKRMAA